MTNSAGAECSAGIVVRTIPFRTLFIKHWWIPDSKSWESLMAEESLIQKQDPDACILVVDEYFSKQLSMIKGGTKTAIRDVDCLRSSTDSSTLDADTTYT